MQQRIKSEIAQLLSRNVGNRLTEEMIVGLSVKIGSLIDQPLHDLERLQKEKEDQANG